MKCVLFLPILLLLLFHIFPSTANAKSMIEPCNSNEYSCTALLSYRLPWASKLSEIAYRFQVSVLDILAANFIDPIRLPLRNYQILQAKTLIKIPISCLCVDGLRHAPSAAYTVRAADTVDSISEGYGGLVSAEQIRITNGVNESNPLVSGQRLVVPLSCACFNNSDNGVAVVYMSYVVVKGENLGQIAAEFGATVTDLMAVNGLGQGRIRRGDILAVPLPACSSANLNWHNESLIVPNGSYVLTANNCIKCSCDPSDLSLQCSPSGISPSCSHLQCEGSNLFIGQKIEKHSTFGCNVAECVYRGHSGSKIFTSLLNYSHILCSGNKSHSTVSSFSPPSYVTFPFLKLPPSPSPSPAPISSASNSSAMIFPANSIRKHIKNCSRDRRALSGASSSVGLLLLDLTLSFIL